MLSSKIGSGFNNLGNTCFFNAVMQVMMYTPALAQQLNSNLHSASCKKNDWCIFCAMEKLWHQSKKSRVVSPHNIVSNLKQVFKKFRLGRQEDSHQFLRYLVEGMQEAETGKLGKERQKNQKIISKTLTYNDFGGKMRTFVLCLHCHHKSLTSERYYDLSIECQRSNTLLEGLESYFKVDDLTGANKYRCDNCKQLSNAKKGSKIISIPSVVTFQFKRFTNSLRKIGKLIEYPRSLNLNRYMEHEQDIEKTKLELFGVIVHSGSSAGSGHYYAFIKNGQQWFEMNDSNVSRCTEDRVLRQQAYLLFYSRTHSQKSNQEHKHQQMIQQNQQVLTNVRQNNKKQVKIQLNGHKNNNQSQKQREEHKQKNISSDKEKEKEKEKEKKTRKKSTEIKARKLSEQQFEQTKRKLSMDIQQLKEQARQETKVLEPQKNKKQSNNNHSKQNPKIQLNGKLIDTPIFGDKPKQNGNSNPFEQKKVNQKLQNMLEKERAEDEQQEQSLSAPRKLERRRSKQQKLSEMNVMEMLLLYADKIMELNKKVSRNRRSSNRALRSVQNLRKFEMNSKKRKMQG